VSLLILEKEIKFFKGAGFSSFFALAVQKSENLLPNNESLIALSCIGYLANPVHF